MLACPIKNNHTYVRDVWRRKKKIVHLASSLTNCLHPNELEPRLQVPGLELENKAEALQWLFPNPSKMLATALLP